RRGMNRGLSLRSRGWGGSKHLYPQPSAKLGERSHPATCCFIAVGCCSNLSGVVFLQLFIENVLYGPEIHRERQILQQICGILEITESRKRRLGCKPGSGVLQTVAKRKLESPAVQSHTLDLGPFDGFGHLLSVDHRFRQPSAQIAV